MSKSALAWPTSSRHAKSSRRQLAFELMEERVLLATFTWIGGTSGAFDVASNWSGPNGPGSAVPGAGDDAVVDTAGVTIQLTSSTALNSLNTLADTTIDVTDGTFSLTGADVVESLIGTLNLSAGATFDVNGGVAQAGGGTVDGAIDVNSGVLYFAGFATSTASSGVFTLDGPITAATGTYVEFGSSRGAKATVAVNSGATFSGPGLYQVQLGTSLNLNENLSVPNFEFDGGSITGSLTDSGTFTWTGGTFSGAGTLTIPQGNTLLVTTTSASEGVTLIQNGYTLDNAGTTTMNQMGDTGSTTSAVINNTGTFVLQPGVVFGLTTTTVFNNSGTLTVNGGTGLETTEFGGTLNNTGVVNVTSGDFYTAGVDQDTGAKLTGGTWNIAAGATLNINNDNVEMPALTENDANVTLGGAGATFTNFGTLATNAGSLTLGPGAVLNVPGTFTQTAAGTLTPQIGGSSASGAFGQLVAAGAVTLGGALDLALVDNYAPTIADSYAVVTYPSATGAFAAVNKLSPGPGQTLGAQVTPTAVIVSQAQVSAPAALDVQSVAISPSSGLPGDTATVTWNVMNVGSGGAFGAWEDAVYLSTTPTLNSSAMLLAVTPHTGGLASGDSYVGAATITLPAIPPGPVYAIVVVDSRHVVLEGSTATLLAASTQPYTVSAVPSLTVGTPATSAFTDANQDRYFQVTVAAGQSLVLDLASQASDGSLSLSASFDTFPTPSSSDATTQGTFGPSQSLVISPTQQGTYYIDVHSQDGAAATSPFSLTVTTPGFGLTGVAPTTVGAGPVTIAVHGTGLTPNTTYSLVGPTSSIPGSLAQFIDGSLAYVTFDVTGQAAGSYALRATPTSGAAVTLGSALTVTPASVGGIDLAISGPSEVRNALVYPVVVTYTNTGNTDVPAPLIDLNQTASNASMGLSPGTVDDTFEQVLGVAPNGPAGILRAGQQGQFTVYVRASIATAEIRSIQSFFIAQDITADDTTPMDYATLGPILRPEGLSDAQWNAEYTEFHQMVGPTEGDYVQMLDNIATLLPAGVQDPSNPIGDALVELDRAAAAVGNSISGVITTNDVRVSLANQTVVADNTTTGDVFVAATLNDGSFVIPSVTPGSYTMSVQGAVVSGSPSVTVASGQAVSGVDLVLGLGGVVTGRVTDSEGVVVADPEITAIDTTGDGYTVTGDAEGRYDLSGLTPGTYTLTASADGLAQTSMGGIVVNNDEQAQDFVLADQSILTGSVAPATGGPTGGTLLVSAQLVDDPSTVIDGTAQGGSYEIDNLPAGTYDITLSLDGYVTQTVSNIAVAQGTSQQLATTALPLAATLSGTVSSSNPEAAPAYALVSLTSDGTTIAATIADASGAFSLAGLPSGTYTIQVLTQAGLISAQSVTLAPSQDLSGVTVAISPPGEPSQAASGTRPDYVLAQPVGPSALQMAIDAIQNQSERAVRVYDQDEATYNQLNPMCPAAQAAKGEVKDALQVLELEVDKLTTDTNISAYAIQQELKTIANNPNIYKTGLPQIDVDHLNVTLGAVNSSENRYYSASLSFDLAVHDFNAVNAKCQGPPSPQKPGGVPFGAVAEQPGDPNEKSGPGFGTQGFVAANQVLPYDITFENEPSANAPALEVIVTDQLDTNLDWTTFSLGPIVFGSNVITVPAGLQSYSTTVVTTNTDGTPLDVVVTASFNLSTGLATWIFRSVDPATGQFPLGAQDGFLPVENGTGRGTASVFYTIKPKAGLPNGATFSNSATVVFDTNAPITTDSVPGTIDSVPPTSAVSPLPATESKPSFTVSWSGSDANGSGIAAYDVYVSTDNGPFTPFLTGTTATSATFTGVVGDSYRFYTIAVDNVGNRQAVPGAIQTTTVTSTTVQQGPPPPSGYGLGRDAFVEVMYRDELARWPEPSELRFWSSKLAKGATPWLVALAIGESPEHRTLVREGLAPRIRFVKAFVEAIRAGRAAQRSKH